MSAILFDRDQVDHLDDLPERPERLNGSKLLWVDIDRRSPESMAKILGRSLLTMRPVTAWRSRLDERCSRITAVTST